MSVANLTSFLQSQGGATARQAAGVEDPERHVLNVIAKHDVIALPDLLKAAALQPEQAASLVEGLRKRDFVELVKIGSEQALGVRLTLQGAAALWKDTPPA
jgi:RIO-like serine/threonine protein kinase